MVVLTFMKSKWSFYQSLAFIILIICLSILDDWMHKNAVVGVNSYSRYVIGGMFFLFITWIYITFYLQYKKYPQFIKHSIWAIMPIILSSIGVLSMIGFIILVTIGPFLDWLEQGSWLLYIMFGYATILYYFFMMSLVHKMSPNKNHIIHQTYVWALALLFFLAFIF